MDKILSSLEMIGLGSVLKALNLNGTQSIPQMLFMSLGALFIFLYGMTLGKTRAFISLLAIYIAFVFDAVFPYLNEIYKLSRFQYPIYFLRTGLFVLVYLIVLVAMSRSFMKVRFSLKDFAFFSVIIVNFLQMGLLISILISFVPTEIGIGWLGHFYVYFGSSEALFIWALLPLLMIPSFKRRKEREADSE